MGTALRGRVRWITVAVAAGLLASCGAGAPRRFSGASILWVDDDQRPFLPRPERRSAPRLWDALDEMIIRPAARALAFDTSGESINVNALDEVPSSSWFENRIGRRPMSIDEVRRGACASPTEPPLPWTIVSGKADGEGVGFVFEDASGQRHLLKADRPEMLEQTTAADAIGAALYHAVGYRVPCNRVVFFEGSWLRLAPDAEIDLTYGERRAMTEEDVTQALGAMHRTANGGLRAMASRYVEGQPLGPWSYRGTWSPDLNDAVPHEDRRELRGMRVLNAWLDHWDARQHNTLAAWQRRGPDGAGHVRHYLVDFGDILGFIRGPHRRQIRLGRSQWLDPQHIFEDFVTLGLVTRSWDVVERGPTWPVFGYFDVERFDPDEWRPNYWNGAFERMTERDAAWMARILSRFDAAHIEAVVELGRFHAPALSERLVTILLGRRERILERYLTRLSALADPHVHGRRACFVDLLVRAGLRASSARRHAAWRLDEGGARAEALAVAHRGPFVCVEVGPVATYAVVRIASRTGDDAPSAPLDLHLRAPERRLRIVGLERRLDAGDPW